MRTQVFRRLRGASWFARSSTGRKSEWWVHVPKSRHTPHDSNVSYSNFHLEAALERAKGEPLWRFLACVSFASKAFSRAEASKITSSQQSSYPEQDVAA